MSPTFDAPTPAPAAATDAAGAGATAAQDPVPWLSDAEQHTWRSYLRGSRALELALDAELQAMGLTLAEYELLSMLSESETGSMRMSALADLVIQSRSRVTHTATRLQRRGWVSRRPTPDDGRGIELVLTDEGHSAIEAAAQVHVRGVQTHLMQQMDPQMRQNLGEAMSRVLQHLMPGYDS
ncbi:MarR family winged helix-turn-helix transcriptional regulator [Rudaeicoccus suwonensis]|nr:MarR family transcriptional regulator [Rudaeicoccus suwonensis]